MSATVWSCGSSTHRASACGPVVLAHERVSAYERLGPNHRSAEANPELVRVPMLRERSWKDFTQRSLSGSCPVISRSVTPSTCCRGICCSKSCNKSAPMGAPKKAFPIPGVGGGEGGGEASQILLHSCEERSALPPPLRVLNLCPSSDLPTADMAFKTGP